MRTMTSYTPRNDKEWSMWLKTKFVINKNRIVSFEAILQEYFSSPEDYVLEYDIGYITCPNTGLVEVSTFNFEYRINRKILNKIAAREIPRLNLTYLNFVRALAFGYALNQETISSSETEHPSFLLLVEHYNRVKQEIKNLMVNIDV